VPRVQKVRGRDVPAAVAAIAIAIADGAVADAVREAGREVTVVAILAVAADADEGRIALSRVRFWEGHGFSRAAQSQ